MLFPKHSQPDGAYDPHLCSAWHERGAPALLAPVQVQDVGGNWLPAGWHSCGSALCVIQAWHCLISMYSQEGDDNKSDSDPEIMIKPLHKHLHRNKDL